VSSRTHSRELPGSQSLWLAPAHFPDPFGTVTRDRGGRHWAGRR
jgi:hypothetical protein